MKSKYGIDIPIYARLGFIKKMHKSVKISDNCYGHRYRKGRLIEWRYHADKDYLKTGRLMVEICIFGYIKRVLTTTIHKSWINDYLKKFVFDWDEK